MSVDQIFRDDELRKELVLKKQIEKFIATYKRKRKVAKENTGSFWDEKLKRQTYKRDWITKDRIKQVEKLIPSNSKTLLNIGVGKGILEKRINKTRPSIELFGIDITRRSLKNLKSKINANLKRGSILKIPHNRKFDVVTVLEVLEHMHPQRIFVAYREIKRVLKKKGCVIFSVPVNEKYSSKYNPNRHLRRYSIEVFRAELQLSKFKILKEIKLFAFRSLYPVKKFLAKYILTDKWKPNVYILVAKKI